VSAFIRLDPDHFAIVHPDLRPDMFEVFRARFEVEWPGKKLLFVSADEFVDLTNSSQVITLEES
jgi:hypothetical protein